MSASACACNERERSRLLVVYREEREDRTVEKLRLFWAITIPAAIREELAEIQAVFRRLQLDVKWVETENFHVTVRFLGSVDTSLIEPLMAEVSERVSGTAQFKLGFGGIGVFPSVKKPRVLWVGLRGHEPVAVLHRQVEEAVVSLGLPREEKAFSPHVTIGRFRAAANCATLERKIAEVDARHVGEFTVTGLDLLASRLTRHGPVYSMLRRIAFSGGGSGEEQKGAGI
ncbi:MAG TPA: RNA 2',3'-cyclic phosphodiesterase [Desulfotomaculum sp.]|nr:RNA 2',3'-cyclic phosphodiesterase [Desulfotomaculum sp.]